MLAHNRLPQAVALRGVHLEAEADDDEEIIDFYFFFSSTDSPSPPTRPCSLLVLMFVNSPAVESVCCVASGPRAAARCAGNGRSHPTFHEPLIIDRA